MWGELTRPLTLKNWGQVARNRYKAERIMCSLIKILMLYLKGFFHMNNDYTSGYLSIIGYSYLNPLGVLLEKLFSLDQRDPNEVQTSPLENGYSVSLIILTVLMVESLVRRVQFFVEKGKTRSSLQFIRNNFSEYENIDDIEELFVVRDVIAHNHVWGCQIIWEKHGDMKFGSIDDRIGGDDKFDRVIDTKKRKTRSLGINLFPTRINREDVIIVLKEVLDFLLYIENKDRNYVYITPQFLLIDNTPVSFVDYVRRICS